MSLHNNIEQLTALGEQLARHASRLESLANQLSSAPFPEGGSKVIDMPDGPSPKPATIVGQFESCEFDLRRYSDRIGLAINRLAGDIEDPRNATASASKY